MRFVSRNMHRPLAMLGFLLSGSILFDFAGADAYAAELTAEARLSAVTVYADRAVATREGRMSLSAGQHELLFSGLPAGVSRDSVQVSIRGAHPSSILDISLRQRNLDQPDHPRVAQLENAINSAQAEINHIEDQTAVLQNRRDFIGQLQAGIANTGAGNAALDLGDARDMLALSAETLEVAFRQQRDLDKKKADLSRRLQTLQAELSSLRNAQRRQSLTAIAKVDIPEAGDYDLVISYGTTQVAWKAAYDARLSSSQRRVNLGYFGMVEQRTGEDWNNVMLTLSTAQPARGGRAAELPPWIVDIAPERPNLKMAFAPAPASSARAESNMASAAQDEAEQLIASRPKAANVQTGLSSATFQIPTPVSLPSDGSSQKVNIATLQLPVELIYRATPSVHPTAFLTGLALNESELPLLAGTISAYVDDAFIATSPLKNVMPGEKLELAFGADAGISVSRKLIQRYTESTGFSGAGRRVIYDYEIAVENHKKTEERLVLKDRKPVSRNEKITVKLLKPNAQAVTQTPDGELEWDWKLVSGEKKTIPLSFSIDYPADADVTGIR
jgi:uncharacterized protein (TIGR02231 family)